MTLSSSEGLVFTELLHQDPTVILLDCPLAILLFAFVFLCLCCNFHVPQPLWATTQSTLLFPVVLVLIKIKYELKKGHQVAKITHKT